MKRNDGKALENIVAILETTQLPEGSTVERRHPVYDDNRVQIAEMDIFITSPLGGSMTVKSLIECRDRPSEGAAPVNWIESLDSRRTRLKLDKVMAVSSTGFSPGAVQWAERCAIELRTFETITPDAVLGWLPKYAPLRIATHHLVTARIMFAEDQLLASLADPGVEVEAEPELREHTKFQLASDQSSVVHRHTGQRQSFRDIWDRAARSPEFFAGLNDGEKRLVTIKLDRHALADYVVELDGRRVGLYSAEFDTEFTNEWSKLPLARAGSYVNEAGEKLFAVGHWKGQPTDPVAEMFVILTPKRPE